MTGLLLLLAFVAALWSVWIWMIVDVLRTPPHAFKADDGLSKGVNLALVLLTGGLGALYYLVRVRPRVGEAARVDLRPRPEPMDDPKGYRQWKKGEDPWAGDSG
ncbi:MAG TPA: hypothetical protein VGS21_00950 [Acidimicrobiales bacterium]|nr:hypothetical protein [Acidimicrobiales bacterium]